MKRVERSEIVDYVTYEERRDAVRQSAMKAKAAPLPNEDHVAHQRTASLRRDEVHVVAFAALPVAATGIDFQLIRYRPTPHLA